MDVQFIHVTSLLTCWKIFKYNKHASKRVNNKGECYGTKKYRLVTKPDEFLMRCTMMIQPLECKHHTSKRLKLSRWRKIRIIRFDYAVIVRLFKYQQTVHKNTVSMKTTINKMLNEIDNRQRQRTLIATTVNNIYYHP